MKGGPSRRFVISIARSKLFVTLSIIFFVISIAISYAAATEGLGGQDKYISISTLDRNMLTDSYFEHSNSTVSPYDVLHWNVKIYNHMQDAEYISVRARIIDSAQSSPNDTIGVPANGTIVFEKRLVLAMNSSAIVPFNWEFQRDNSTLLTSDYTITINGVKKHFSGPAIHKGEELGIVFEVWTFDPSKMDFEYGWLTDSATKYAWNQLWFSAAT